MQAPIIDQDKKVNLKRKIEETSLLETEKDQPLKKQKVEEADKK